MTQRPSMSGCTFQGYLSCSLFPFPAVSACAWSGHLKSAEAKLSSGLCTPAPSPTAQSSSAQLLVTPSSQGLRLKPCSSPPPRHLSPSGKSLLTLRCIWSHWGQATTSDLDRNRLPPLPLLCPHLHPTSMPQVSSTSKSGCTYQDVIQASSLLTRSHRPHTWHTGLSSAPFRSWCCPEAHAGTRQPQAQPALSSAQTLSPDPLCPPSSGLSCNVSCMVRRPQITLLDILGSMHTPVPSLLLFKHLHPCHTWGISPICWASPEVPLLNSECRGFRDL